MSYYTYRPKLSSKYPFRGAVRSLILLNSILYLVLILAKNFWLSGFEFILMHLFLIPERALLHGEIHQFITYMFFHDPMNIFHIFFNMFVLWMFGSMVENKLGKRLFIYYYLICGISGGFLHTIGSLILPSIFGGMAVGASGAVLGILLCFALVYSQVPIYLFFMLPLKGIHLIYLSLTIDFIYFITGENIAILAHLGGMLAGFIMLKGLYRPDEMKYYLKSKLRKFVF